MVYNFYYSCFYLYSLIHILALLSITSFIPLVFILYVAMTLRIRNQKQPKVKSN